MWRCITCGEFELSCLKFYGDVAICHNCNPAQPHIMTTCTECGRYAPCQLHHVNGPFLQGAMATGPVRPLCLNCHVKLHREQKHLRKYDDE
jgi:hypothetical protein